MVRVGTLTFEWDGHTISVGPSTIGTDVTVTLNNDKAQPVSDPMSIHLDLSKMACCIGDACLMWPPKPTTTTSSISSVPLGMPTIQIGGFGTSASSGSWKITALQTEDPKEVIVGGQSTSVQAFLDNQAKTAGEQGGALSFEWNGNTIDITLQNGSVSVTLNNTNTQAVPDPQNIHLDLSEMACCIGDACLMWPPKPASSLSSSTVSFGTSTPTNTFQLDTTGLTTSSISSSSSQSTKVVDVAVNMALQEKNEDVEFLRSVVARLGDADARRFAALIDRAAIEATADDLSVADANAPLGLDQFETAAAVQRLLVEQHSDEASTTATANPIEQHGQLRLCHTAEAFDQVLQEATTNIVVLDLWVGVVNLRSTCDYGIHIRI